MFDNIIIGAGYKAIGFCLGFGGNNLIISQSIYIDDFSPCFRLGECKFHTENGKMLYDEFENEGLVRDGIVDTVRGAVMLYQKVEQNQIDVLYQTFVSGIQKMADGFIVTVQNWEGTKTFFCRNVIDLKQEIKTKTFNALVFGDGEYCTESFYPDLRILRLPVDLSDTLDVARLKMMDFIHRQKNIEIILTATAFDNTYKDQNLSPFEYFENGYSLGLEQMHSNQNLYALPIAE